MKIHVQATMTYEYELDGVPDNLGPEDQEELFLIHETEAPVTVCRWDNDKREWLPCGGYDSRPIRIWNEDGDDLYSEAY